jgi:hypothetical protein
MVPSGKSNWLYHLSILLKSVDVAESENNTVLAENTQGQEK